MNMELRDKKKHNVSLKGYLEDFKYAKDGLKSAYQNEQSLWLHAICTIGIIILGFLLQISFNEWAVIVIALVIVLVVELLNTAIEATVDLVTEEKKPMAKVAKDCASGAVGIISIIALIIGIMIFLPKIIALF